MHVIFWASQCNILIIFTFEYLFANDKPRFLILVLFQERAALVKVQCLAENKENYKCATNNNISQYTI